MNTLTLVLLLILIPMVGAIIAGLLRRKLSDVVALLAAGLTLVIGGYLISQVFPGTKEQLFATLPWIQDFVKGGLFGYLIDPLSILMLTVVIISGFLVVLYSMDYLDVGNKEHPSAEGKERHHFWMLLFIGSMIGVALSPNLLQLYIFWEMTTLCSWALISHYRNPASLKAGYKALLMTVTGGIFFFLTLAILFVKTGSFDFAALDKVSPSLRAWLFFFLLIAAWAKSAQVPFYTWLPDAMEAPTTVSMYLHAAAMVKAGVFLIARTAISSFSLSFGSGLLVAVMAVITMMVGVYLFFFQDDLKRLLAYSTITHLSYILFGVGLGIMGSTVGLSGGIMHIMNHGVSKGLLFLCVGAISYGTGIRSIKELSGLYHRMPLVTIAFMIGFLSLTGVPPFAGFWSKFFILIGTINVGGTAGWLLLIPFLLEIILAFAWFLRVGHKVFFGEASAKGEEAADPPLSIAVSLIVLMILCVVAPLIALPIVNQIHF